MRTLFGVFISTGETQANSYAQDEVHKDFDDLSTTKVEATPLLVDMKCGLDHASLNDRKASSLDSPASLASVDDPAEESATTWLEINQNIKETQQLYLDLLSDCSEKMGDLSSADEEQCRRLMSEIQSQWMDETEEQNQTQERAVEQLMLLKIAIRKFNDFIVESSTQDRSEKAKDFVRKAQEDHPTVQQKKVKLKEKKLQEIADLVDKGSALDKTHALVLFNEYVADKASSLKPFLSAVNCLIKWSELNSCSFKDADYYINLSDKFQSLDKDTELTNKQLLEKLMDLEGAVISLEELKGSNKVSQLLCQNPVAPMTDQEQLVHLMLKAMTCSHHCSSSKEEQEIFDRMGDYIGTYSDEKSKKSEGFDHLGSIYYSFMQILVSFFDNPDLARSILSQVTSLQEAYAVAKGYNDYFLQSGKKNKIICHSHKIDELRQSNRFDCIPGEYDLSLAKKGVAFFENLTGNRAKELESIKRQSLDISFAIIRQEAISGVIQRKLNSATSQIRDGFKNFFRGVRVKLSTVDGHKVKVAHHKRIEQEINDVLKGYARLEITEDGDEFLLNLTKERFNSADDEEVALNEFLGRISSRDKEFDTIKDALIEKGMADANSDDALKFKPRDGEKLSELISFISGAADKVIEGYRLSEKFIDDTELKLESLKSEKNIAQKIEKNNSDMIEVIKTLLIRKRNAEVERIRKEAIKRERNKGFKRYIPRVVFKIMEWFGFLNDKYHKPNINDIKLPNSVCLYNLKDTIEKTNMSDISAIDPFLKDCRDKVKFFMESDVDNNAVYYKILLHFLDMSTATLKRDGS